MLSEFHNHLSKGAVNLFIVTSRVLPYQQWLSSRLCANTQQVDDVHMAADHLHDLHLLHKTDRL